MYVGAMKRNHQITGNNHEPDPVAPRPGTPKSWASGCKSACTLRSVAMHVQKNIKHEMKGREAGRDMKAKKERWCVVADDGETR